MSIDDKREYLKSYRMQQLRIRRYNELIHDYPELAEKYAARLEECFDAMDKTEREIDAVDGGVLTELLCQKYICGKSLEEIGLCMNYSKRHMERMHMSALEKFKVFQ